MWLEELISLARLQAKDFIKFSFCVIVYYNGVTLIAELQADAVSSTGGSDSHALIDETLANRFLNSRSDGFVTAHAERLYLLRHKIVNDSQCLGVKVKVLV